MTIISQGSLKGIGGDVYLYVLHFATIKHVVNFIRPISTLSGISETSDLPNRFVVANGCDESHVRGSDLPGLFQPTQFPLDTIITSHKIHYGAYIFYYFYYGPKIEPVAQQPVIKSYFYAIIRPNYSFHHINEHCSYTILLIYDTDVLLPHVTSNKPGDQTPGYLKNTLTKDRQPITKEAYSGLKLWFNLISFQIIWPPLGQRQITPGGVFFMEEVSDE